jgi:hypothetical protein
MISRYVLFAEGWQTYLHWELHVDLATQWLKGA